MIQETCDKCGGTGGVRAKNWPGYGGDVELACSQCGGSGRITRPFSSPPSDVGGPDEYDNAQAEITALRARLEASELKYRAVSEALSECQTQLDASERGAAAMREALEHCIDLGPPCPSCDAEDGDVESAGEYPHHAGCLALAALASDAGRDFVPRAELEQLQARIDRAQSKAENTPCDCGATYCAPCLFLEALRKPDGGK